MIDDFTGQYAFLSNFYNSPVSYDGLTFQNSEAAYQAAKTAEPALRIEFVDLCADDAKRLGRNIPMRSDWDFIRFTVMSAVIRAKFEQSPTLTYLLVDTGDEELIEGNYWHDNTWGDCKCPKCVDVPGQNILGRILMSERAYWQQELNRR